MKSSLLLAVVLVLSSAPVRSATTPSAPFFAAKPASCAKASNASNALMPAKAPRPSFFREAGTAGVPQPVFDTGCTAEVECPGPGGTHTPLSCTGASSCSIGEAWVTCDNTSHYCGCVGCDLCRCDCFEGGGSAHDCLLECRFNC